MTRVARAQREGLAKLLVRKTFRVYRRWVTADDLVSESWHRLYVNRMKIMSVMTKFVGEPLGKMSGDMVKDRTHCISFFRRLASYFGECLMMRKRTVMVGKNRKTLYEYQLIKF